MQIFGKTFTTLEQSLDMRMLNQHLITANLANMDTPGYTAQRLDFQASMEQAMRGAREAAVVAPSEQPATSLDGNNVDMDQEVSQLSQNKLMYSIQNQLTAAKFRQLTTVLDAER